METWLSLLGSLIGTLGGIISSAILIKYRIEQLEKKVEKHNSVVERMTIAELNIKNIFHKFDEIIEEIRRNGNG